MIMVRYHVTFPVLNLPSHIFTSDESVCGSDLHTLQSSRWRPLYQRFTGWKSSNLEYIWSESCGLDRSSWNGYCYLLLSWWRGSYIPNFYWFSTCKKPLPLTCNHIRVHSQLASESTKETKQLWLSKKRWIGSLIIFCFPIVEGYFNWLT